MKIKLYINNDRYIGGITLKDEAEPEANNMALHACINTDDIIENRKKLAAHLQCMLQDFTCAYQTHSDHFYRVTMDDKGRGAYSIDTAIYDTDALYTKEPNILLCCFTADCVPLLFYHEITGIIGVIHSGWQGSVKEITLKLFQHLINNEDCKPDYFKIWIGRALSQEKFEVDKDVAQKFINLKYADDFISYNHKTCKYHIDNQLTVKAQCKMAGIPVENVDVDRSCTFNNRNSFSYRQSHKTGRHLSFILKRK